MRFSIWPAFVLVAFALVGCYDIRETILLRRDLSGTLDIVATIHYPEGEGVSRAAFEEERAGLIDELREQAERQNPEGVRLRRIDYEWASERETRLVMEIEFDHVRKLAEIRDPEEGAGESKETPSLNAVECEEKEDRWVFRQRIAERAKENPQGDLPLVDVAAYKDRVFRLEVRPDGRVLATNGDQRGRSLWWERKMEEIVSAKDDLWAEWEIAK